MSFTSDSDCFSTPMKFFCDNPLCRLHAECPPGVNRMEYVEANGKKVVARRFAIAPVGGAERWTFCEICANVLAITQGEKPKTEKPNETRETVGQDTETGPVNSVGSEQRSPDQPQGEELLFVPPNYDAVPRPSR